MANRCFHSDVYCVMYVSSCCCEQQLCWDLRWIPFILGALYGGYRLGLLLLGIVLFIRLFTGGMVGFYFACITFPLIGLLAIYVSKYYVRMTIKQKVCISISLTLLALGCSSPFHAFFSQTTWTLFFGLSIV